MKHRNRRSIRLSEYDYSNAGAYYVTICVQDRECLFGDIENGKMVLNDAGKIVNDAWQWLGNRYKYVEMDEFIVMPNHMHAIINIVGAIPCLSGRQACNRPNNNKIHVYDRGEN